MTEIGDNAFDGCTGLTSIVVSEGNKVYDSRNHCNAIIETKSKTLIFGCKNTVIPDSVKKIGDSAFEGCTGLTSIVIPDSVKEIGWSAFHRCMSLTSIVIPESVTVIEESAFFGCESLKSASVLGPVKKMRETFDSCSALETVTLGVGIQKFIFVDYDIGEEFTTFDNCPSLETIYVPAKKSDYYKKRLPEELHDIIVELPAEKKAKKK